MRRLLTGVLTLSCTSLAGLLILLTSLRLSGLSTVTIKEALIQTNVYEQTITSLLNLLSTSETPKEAQVNRSLTLLIKQEVTPTYLQTKTETLIDDVAVWLKDPTASPPTVSFADLKDKIVKKNPQLYHQLLSLADEYERQKPAMQKAMNEAASQTGEAPSTLPDLPIKEILQGDFTYNVSSQLSWLQPLYLWTYPRYYYLIALLGLLLLLIVFLNFPRPFGALSFTFLSLTLTTGVPYLLYRFSPTLLTRYLPTTLNIPPLLLSFQHLLLNPLLISYSKVATVALIGGATLTVLTFLLRHLSLTSNSKK